MLGPILFNICLNNLFSFLKEIDVCNFADNTTPFVGRKNLAELLEKLERNSELAVHWFKDNYMKNTNKCHLFISGHKYEHQWAQVRKDMVWEKNKIKLFGITKDNELKFDNHILNICSKVHKKLCILCRLKNILTFHQ